ncbi:MAG: hypothetical protein HY097_02355 [Nitrospinae bacterium]|nr:hypothetical protein [Nitrospinota bacterium]MBI3814447.1 hypothetical protein [Nitrospinota bacterium]
MRFDDAVEINPSRTISRGAIAPHISMDILQSFAREISGFAMNHNINQSRSLASIRDTLLPKLLSGEIRVTKEVQEDIINAK